MNGLRGKGLLLLQRGQGAELLQPWSLLVHMKAASQGLASARIYSRGSDGLSNPPAQQRLPPNEALYHQKQRMSFTPEMEQAIQKRFWSDQLPTVLIIVVGAAAAYKLATWYFEADPADRVQHGEAVYLVGSSGEGPPPTHGRKKKLPFADDEGHLVDSE